MRGMARRKAQILWLVPCGTRRLSARQSRQICRRRAALSP
jgi:hypothetical protein